MRIPAVLAALSLLLAPLPAVAKPKGCFSAAEHQTEWEVRHGLRLRESAARCGEYFAPGAPALWKSVEDALGTQFRQQTDKRRKMFEREFGPKAASQLLQWDGRIVTYFRHYPVSGPFCREVTDRLTELQKRGWNAFRKQAAKDKGEIAIDYKLCR